METSRLSAKGQVTIPRRVRDALGLRPGDLVGYEVQNGIVILRRVLPFDAAFHDGLSATVQEEWASPEDEAAYGGL